TQQYFPGWSEPLTAGPRAEIAALPLAIGGVAAILCVVLALLATRALRGGFRWTIVGFILVAVLHQAFLQYHVAALCWLTALVLAWRSRGVDLRFLAALLAGAAGLAIAQFLGATAGDASARQTAGAMLGWPSVWPYVQVARFSWVAAIVVGIGGI